MTHIATANATVTSNNESTSLITPPYADIGITQSTRVAPSVTAFSFSDTLPLVRDIFTNRFRSFRHRIFLEIEPPFFTGTKIIGS